MSAEVLEAEADDAPAYRPEVDEAVEAVTDGIADEIGEADDEIEVALLERLRDTAREGGEPQVLGTDGDGDGRAAVREAESLRSAIEELRKRLATGLGLTDHEACHFWSIAFPSRLADDSVPF